jgi:hypothetical protein
MTSDHHTTTASLESALAEAKAKAAEDTYHLELLLDAEKASHTDTLVKLRLTEERLAASEAERERLRRANGQLQAHLDMFGVVVKPPSNGFIDPDSYMSADHDEPTDSDAAITLVMNERPE